MNFHWKVLFDARNFIALNKIRPVFSITTYKMPRGKSKNTINTQNNPSSEESKKIEAPNISLFKFEKKPHIKIEFEKDSPKTAKEESKGLWEPANWRDFLINLRNMRSNNDAPVDSMGCHMTMDENAPPKVMRYQSLIALMLSSQTKDQVTFAAMERLRERGLTVENILKLSDEELGKLIYPVGFWKTKVKYIKKTTQTLKEQYDGDIPDSVDKLCKLTGVGPKMAHICMQVAWNKTTGIGVDTHVHRISNRIGWVRKPTTTPEDTRKALQSWLPFDLWSEVNHLMVGFGQTICQPVNPMCYECLNNDICPSSEKLGRKSPKKKSPLKQNVKSDVKQEFETPVKEDEALVSSRNQKLTPKKNLTPTGQVDQAASVKGDLKDNSRKRKTTPKKNLEIVYAEDITNLKTQGSMPSPNKKKISPKGSKVVDEIDRNSKTVIINNIDYVSNNFQKPPSKRKATRSQEGRVPSMLSPEDDETIPLTAKTGSNKESASTKSSKPKNTDHKTTQIKRKSPRNKNSSQM